jgi:hypothetical protein
MLAAAETCEGRLRRFQPQARGSRAEDETPALQASILFGGGVWVGAAAGLSARVVRARLNLWSDGCLSWFCGSFAGWRGAQGVLRGIVVGIGGFRFGAKGSSSARGVGVGAGREGAGEL